MSHILAKLNPSQLEAVTTTEGPLLIIAGAGSGKTRALTHRVAYLICEKNVPPRNILAVTFTNKAANEMKERIKDLLSPSPLAPLPPAGEEDQKKYAMPTVGTFHSICVRILRHEIEKIGYKSSFNIFDDQDQLALMKRTMREMEIDIDQFKPKSILGAISQAKNELRSAEDFAKNTGGYWEEIVAKIYLAYQKKLKEQEALDFDDILMLTVKIFKTYPEVLQKYQNFFHYIMVDEYQDTNQAQYTLIKMLSEKRGNICVVGDDWQGIYSWRGANIQNILDFEKDYPAARIIKLEQNYRSTQNILDAAYGVISKNINRKDKKIWTENQGGQLIVSYEAANEREEAEFIAREIERLHHSEQGEPACRQAGNLGILHCAQDDNCKFSDFVVLYRTNAQSRIIEEAMLAHSIPYRIIGGLKFYQRKEIKDIIAYLRLIQNFQDATSLERIINEPRRNIGDITLKHWLVLSKENNCNPIDFGFEIQASHLKAGKIQASKIDGIIKFCEFIKRMSELKSKLPLTDFMQKVFSESGYEKFLTDGTEEGEMRLENVRELLTVAKKYDEFEREEGLKLFLEEVALISDTDNINQASEAVHLMTLHSAKGLEFETVFIAGLEEGILPHARSMLNASEMEEERRLMYVGLTRAKQKAYLLFTAERNIFGSTQVNAPSRFLDDIPEHLLETCNAKPDLWNKKTEEESVLQENISHFKDGDRVLHEVFGEGLIVASQGDILTVAFKKAGLKKLAASIAPLKKI